MPQFQSSDGLSLYYEDTPGDKGAVLCLGGLTRTVRDFDYVRPHLEGYQVIAMDYRGRGKSEYDRDYRNYNVLREAHDATELLDKRGIERCAILGTSRGGLIGMLLAAQAPDRICGVILNDVGPIIGASGLAQIMSYVGKRPPQKTYAEFAATLRDAHEGDSSDIPDDRWLTEAENRFIEMPDGLHLRYDPHLHTALLEQSASQTMPDFPLYFSQMTNVPTGVIRGEYSNVLTQDILDDMHRKNPALVSTIVPNRSHPPFLDEPESLDLIRQILNRCAA